jgi:RNA polymerase sigma-70 factor (ECF subfamily)
LLLHDARRAARVHENGSAISLSDQDRTRWDHATIEAALQLLESTLARGRPGRFQLEAAISAVHSRARNAKETDWTEIAELYCIHEQLAPSPAVRVNRAFALGRAIGPHAGLTLLDADPKLTAEYPYHHAVRGSLLRELGRRAEATSELELAIEKAHNAEERRQLHAMLAELREAR